MGASGGSSYEAYGVDWNNGGFIQKTSALRANGGAFTMSTWFFYDVTSSGGYLYQHQINGQFGGVYDCLEFRTAAGGDINFSITNHGGSRLMTCNTAAGVADRGSWNHCVTSWNGTSGKFFVNGVDQTNATFTNGTFPWTSGLRQYRVGGSSGSTMFNGAMAEFYLDDTYIDLTQASNRSKFYSGQNLPVDLGADGSKPTGAQPMVYFKLNWGNGIPNLGNNLGSTGNWTVSAGASTDGGLVTAFL